MMNKDKLKELVSALDALSDNVKDWDVEMESWYKPDCGTPGCHAGLISIVAKNYQSYKKFTSAFISCNGIFVAIVMNMICGLMH